MTLIDTWTSKRAYVTILSIGGFAVAIAGACLSELHVVPVSTPVAALPGCLVLAISLLYGYYFGFHCPYCRANLGLPVMQSTGFVPRPKWNVRFCFSCGRDLSGD